MVLNRHNAQCPLFQSTQIDKVLGLWSGTVNLNRRYMLHCILSSLTRKSSCSWYRLHHSPLLGSILIVPSINRTFMHICELLRNLNVSDLSFFRLKVSKSKVYWVYQLIEPEFLIAINCNTLYLALSTVTIRTRLAFYTPRRSRWPVTACIVSTMATVDWDAFIALLNSV